MVWSGLPASLQGRRRAWHVAYTGCRQGSAQCNHSTSLPILHGYHQHTDWPTKCHIYLLGLSIPYVLTNQVLDISQLQSSTHRVHVTAPLPLLCRGLPTRSGQTLTHTHTHTHMHVTSRLSLI